MARYRFSIDAGTFIGARFLNLTLTDGGKPIPGIFIPAGINGIEVQTDNRDEGKRNPSGIRAFLNFQQRICNNKYIEAVKQSLMRKGEEITLYNVPAYQVAYTLPEEKRKPIREALKKRILAEHPEWKDQTDTQGTDLSRAISTLMPYQVGDSYLMEEQNAQQQPRNASAPVSQAVSGYSSPTSNDYDPFGGEQAPDDLPF